MSARGRWVPERWQQRWLDLSGRERTGLSLALGLLALALVWSVGVAPAWRQWQQGQAQTQALQTQWQSLQALQAQVGALKGQSRVRPDDAARLLQTSVATLCLLYTTDAADEKRGVTLGGRRNIKKKK